MPFKTIDAISMRNAYSCDLLDFVSNTEIADKKTGELFYVKKRKYLNLNFTFKTNNNDDFQELIVRGSIHTFFNNGLHNANRLTFNQFKATLNSYNALFGIDLTKCKLLPLENGTNLYLNDFEDYKYNIDDIIQNTICIKRKMFNYNAGIETSLISGTSKNEVRQKIYSKSADYPKYCKDNVLRIEDKLTKIRGIETKGIVFVSDLHNLKNHIILLEKHIENISNIVIYDYTIDIPKKSKYKKDNNELKTRNYWRKLIKDCKSNNEYPTKYNDKVVLLNKLSKTYGTNLLEKIKQFVVKQSIEDLGLCAFNTFKIHKKPKNAPLLKPKNAQLYIWCISFPYTIISFSKSKDRKCLITGLNIAMQKDSILLSHTGLRHYYKTDKKIYNQIKRKHLTSKWINSDFETQVKEIAHNIRDCKRNQELKQQRLYQSNQLQLFEIDLLLN